MSSHELSTGFERQRSALLDYFGFGSQQGVDRLRETQLSQAEQHLIANLVLYNIGILVLGGAASFAMARRTLRPLEQAMEAQSRFTADASHELRTPLTAMQTEIEVALRAHNLTVAEAKEQLASNLEEVAKLQALSNGLLALANQDAEHFVPRRLSIKSILDQAIKNSATAAKQKEVVIDNQAGNVSVLGDKDSLVQLFAILLENAIKYSPPKTTITISSQVKGNNAHIAVHDQGHGITPSDLPHIFERLYRADSSRTKEKVNGYGLGLSIAKKIVELHCGAIDAISQEGKGSTFTVRLPLAPAEPSEQKTV